MWPKTWTICVLLCYDEQDMQKQEISVQTKNNCNFICHPDDQMLDKDLKMMKTYIGIYHILLLHYYILSVLLNNAVVKNAQVCLFVDFQ